MPRARLISPEFWTSEAVVDCTPMARLLLLGLATFADDFGVQPLRPRTLRLQVFPGDTIDDDQVRVLLDALIAGGLVRRYSVDGVDYLVIADWAAHQRVGRRARRRYPADPATAGRDGVAGERQAASPYPIVHSKPQQNPASDGAAGQGQAALPSPVDHSKPQQNPAAAPGAPPPSGPSAPPDRRGETEDDAAWLGAVEAALRRAWGADLPADLARYALQWRAEGRDLARDVVPAIDRAARVAADCRWPLRLQSVDAALPRMEAAVMAAAAPSALAPAA